MRFNPIPQVHVAPVNSISPKQRRRSVFRSNSRSSLADISSVISGGSGGGTLESTRETRQKRLSMASLRQLSVSLNSLSGDALENSEATSFLITDEADPNVRLLVRAPSVELKWVDLLIIV